VSVTAEAVSAAASVVAAAAAVGTLVIAWVAARYAKGQVEGARAQLEEARTLRKEQAQPYVVAFMESSAASPRIIDFVVKNFGATAAYDLTLTSSPPMRRTGADAHADVWPVGTRIPALVPGQEWRTVWDSSYERFNAAEPVPTEYRVTLHFKDSTGHAYNFEASLDWRVFKSQMWVDTKTAHDAAKSLDAISKIMKKWTEGIHGGLAIYSRNGDTRDRKRREEFEASRREAAKHDKDEA
jgi:hypothetical protein